MNILVLNGSPKGDYSITLQTTNYIKKLNQKHNIEILHVGHKIKALERDMSKAIEMIEKADLLVFSYPVYTFIAPWQLHRFIELLKEAKLDLSNKFATQISTSKHFYDVTAHKYIQDNCADLGLKYINGLSADMDDLLTTKGQKEAEDFYNFVCWSVENNHYERPSVSYALGERIAVTKAESTENKSGDVVILTSKEPDDSQLQAMIDRFIAKCKRSTRVINISEYPFKGGCLGCFNCATTGKCIYKDGFDEFLRNEIQTADAIIFAFTIKDHSMGASFKLYDDRQFCNGHRTVTMGMPMGYLISGDYSKEFNLQMIVESRAQVGGNYLAGVATDEFNPDNEIDKLAETLEYALERRYNPPQNFYGVGGMKIFRDLIWQMQGLMKADHKFYKKHGQYDFPQKKRGRMIAMYAVGALMSNKKLKSKMGNKMNEGMLMPYNSVLDKMNKK
ncbi:MAG TPA: iron-sulfur protein [Clostridiales bacterium]|nr:iron-sulfur protein [Clostridiales bacterium]